ncbi:MAG: hypothetical protein AABM64_18025 [Pseudomonadota bacterium]
MAAVYHLAQGLFVLAGLQYYFCSRNPIFMPAAKGLAVFHAWGAVATIGMLILFVTGFFFLPWWMPFSAWLAGQFAFTFVPQAWKENKGPGVGLLATLAGVATSAALFFA